MLELQLDTLMEVSTPAENVVSPEGLKELYGKFRDISQGTAALLRPLLDEPEDSDWRKWSVTKGGTWPKRFASHAYKQDQVKIPASYLSLIGDILFRNSSQGDKFFFEITKFMDWKPGGFQESTTSCWWGSYNYNRIGLSQHPHGYAVLFYRDQEQYLNHKHEEGIGRCFSMNTERGLTIFNAYGLSLTNIAHVLSLKFGLSYRRLVAYSPHAYINQGNKNNLDIEGGVLTGGTKGTAYLIGETSRISKMDLIELGEFPEMKQCHLCTNMRTVRNMTSFGREQHHYACEECASKLKSCPNCGMKGIRSEFGDVAHNGNKLSVCLECYANAKICMIHGKTVDRVQNIWHTSRQACSSCLMAGKDAALCTGCGHAVDKFKSVNLRNIQLRFCPSCSKRIQEA